MDLFSLSYSELVEYLEQHREVEFTREDWIVKFNEELSHSSLRKLFRDSFRYDQPIYLELLLELHPGKIERVHLLSSLNSTIIEHRLALVDVLLSKLKLSEYEVLHILELACIDNFYETLVPRRRL